MLPELLRPAWRRGLFLRFKLFQQHRVNRPVLEHAAGLPCLVLPGVFNPTLYFSSLFFAEHLKANPLKRSSIVLDIGTGSGLLAIQAAASAAKVFATDINPQALRCARINVLLNQVDEQVKIHYGSMFEPVAGMRFDAVLWNPPYLSGTPTNPSEHAFFGTDLAESFAAGLSDQLRPGGQALIILSDLGDESRFLQAASHADLESRIVAQKSLAAETMTIYSWTVPSSGRSISA